MGRVDSVEDDGIRGRGKKKCIFLLPCVVRCSRAEQQQQQQQHSLPHCLGRSPLPAASVWVRLPDQKTVACLHADRQAPASPRLPRFEGDPVRLALREQEVSQHTCFTVHL